MRVKICGITNVADANEAAGLGAWAIGLVHYEESPRRCDPGAAAEIGAALRRRCEVVGVFVNPTLEEVAEAVRSEGLTMVQLNGEEGPSLCTEIARRTGAKVAKAIHVASGADVQAAEAYPTDFHLFDTRRSGLWGGTGESFDWDLVARRRSSVPMILSGGLNPENVAEAIDLTHPFAVDVASGVEAEPGRKDHPKLSAFFEAAGSVDPAPVR